MFTPEYLLAKLAANPHPKQTHLEMAGGFAYITINGHKIAYNGERWFACGQQITPRFSMNSLHQEIDRVFVLARKIKDHVLDKTTTPSWEQTKEDCVGPDLPTEQTLVSTNRYQELEAELAKVTAERDDLSVRVKQKTDVIVAQAAQIQQHSDGWEQTEAQLEAMTTSRDELQKKVDFIEGRTSDLLAEREQLFTKIKTLTEERDRNESSYNYAQNLLNQVWDATGWLERADNEPCAIEYIKRLKSKADRAGLLSVVCRRLCGDENAAIETVHAAIDRCHEEFSTIEFIKERLGIDPDGPVVSLGEVRSLVTQAVKSLGEKTVEVDRLKISLSATEAQLREVEQGRDHDDGIRSEIAVKVGLDSGASLGLILETVKTVEVSKLQEGLTNYKAQVEGLTKRVEQMTFERDAERVGNKWLSETIEDLKRTTVKLPNEHALRRLFNRHNTPEKYRDGTPIPTMERLLMLIESLESQVSVQTRRAEHMALVNCHHEAMISDTHAILDEHGVQSYAGDTYLGIPTRIRQLFQTHTKV